VKEIVFLLEEPSMREVLNILLPQLLPQHLEFQLITHKGKQDLEKAIPYKLRLKNYKNGLKIIKNSVVRVPLLPI
jgi:hypothetical protein